MAATADAPARVFVGLWPDGDAAQRLDDLAKALARDHPQARRVPRANLHLTLAFIGDLAAPRAAALSACLRTLDSEPFTWTLDRIGAFAGARVAWAGGPTAPGLARLVDQVEALLRGAEVDFDRRPYRPHVTLLRQLPRSACGLARPIAPPIPWRGGRALLLQSAAGRYTEVAAVA
jgi:2'-5' RNA ligase